MAIQKKQKKTNYRYAIVSVSLVLFLLGFFGFSLLITRFLLESSKEKITLNVEIKEGADSFALAELPNFLKNSVFIKPSSLRFVSKEEAARIMGINPATDPLLKDAPLPFYESYSLNIQANYLHPDSLNRIKAYIQQNIAVASVEADSGLIGEISQNIQQAAWVAFGIAFLFLIVAITLIHNTIRLNLYIDRFLIKNMELVGASWGFISRPYIQKGIKNGLTSAFLALLVLFGLFLLLLQQVPDLAPILWSYQLWSAALLLLLVGALIGWWSTYFVVNKHLRMRLDDLY